MKSLIGLKIEALSVAELKDILIKLHKVQYEKVLNERALRALGNISRFVDNLLEKRVREEYVDFDENICWCGHEECDEYTNRKIRFNELVSELLNEIKDDYPIDERLIFVVDCEAYERGERPKEIGGLYRVLIEIFHVFLNDASIVPCVDLEQMQHIIVARKTIPGMILVDVKKNKELKRIIDLKQKFPDTKFFVFATDNSMEIAEEASEVTVISAKRIKISNLFEGVSFLNK